MGKGKVRILGFAIQDVHAANERFRCFGCESVAKPLESIVAARIGLLLVVNLTQDETGYYDEHLIVICTTATPNDIVNLCANTVKCVLGAFSV